MKRLFIDAVTGEVVEIEDQASVEVEGRRFSRRQPSRARSPAAQVGAKKA